MLCSAATLPLSHCQSQARLVDDGQDKSDIATTYRVLESGVGRQPLRRIEHDQLFDKVLGYRVQTTVISFSELSRHNRLRTRHNWRPTFLADVLPVPLVKLDLAPHRLLGHLVRVVRPERLVSAEQDVGDDPIVTQISAPETTLAIILRLVSHQHGDQTQTHPKLHMSQGFP
jgi:hypothetical protein